LAAMKHIFLFTWSVDRSPLREALRYSTQRVTALAIKDGCIDCPITLPPQLVCLEAEPHAPVAPLLGQIREHPAVRNVPVILVLDREWLGMAARLPCDDFLMRGFAPTEAIARIDRLLGTLEPVIRPPLQFGRLQVDVEGHEVRVDDAIMTLAPQEFALLRHLVLNPGRALSREQLLDRVWGRDYFGGVRTVDIHVRRLRQKLGEIVEQRLQTVRGVGYKWNGNSP
jgi:DNA-binding response OmpR family regulator